MLMLTLILGWVVFVYARRLGGDRGGLLSVAAYVSTPTFIAFGPLVLTDLAVTLFCSLTLVVSGHAGAEIATRFSGIAGTRVGHSAGAEATSAAAFRHS
jgi:4-amino-4-deoxy-L-arabinose transferase-like glycosyltransferase